MYYTYMIRCEDNSIYTGITNNLERRMHEHLNQTEKCAKYTLKHKAVNIEAVWQSGNRSLASKLEYYIKSLKKEQKEKIIIDNSYLEKIFGEKLECDVYNRLEKINIKEIVKK